MRSLITVLALAALATPASAKPKTYPQAEAQVQHRQPQQPARGGPTNNHGAAQDNQQGKKQTQVHDRQQPALTGARVIQRFPVALVAESIGHQLGPQSAKELFTGVPARGGGGGGGGGHATNWVSTSPE